MTGDFNAGEDNEAILTLLGKTEPASSHSAAAPLVDSFRVTQPEAKGVGTFSAWVGKTDGNKIDYVFVAPSTNVLKAEVLHDNDNGRYPSDHYPVSARIEF